MKKKLAVLAVIGVLAAPQVVGAEGFGLNEWSAEGVAMGGARMFAEEDAANVAYNPASITKVSGEAIKMGVTYVSPHGKFDLINKQGQPESGHNKIHAGLIPGTYYTKQVSEKDWVAIGAFSRFAMVSEFERTGAQSSNAFLSKMNGISITPTYAHKFDNKWSAAVGAEVNYVGLTLEKNLFGAVPTHLKGDTYAMGWNAAANYTFDDKNEVGVVYRSRITHSLEADFQMNGNRVAGAYGVVTLPDSWSLGYNHKFDKKTRVELNATRTNWSTYDALNVYFDQTIMVPAPVSGRVLPVNASESPKNWESGWRYAIGVEHKLSDKYAVMAGFAYDGSCIPYDGGDFIVPTGNRRTYTIGMQYQDKKESLGVTLGWMQIGDLQFAGQGADMYNSVHTHDNYAKMASISYQRKF